MGVVCLPSREEHGQAWDESCEDSRLGSAEAHGSSLEKTGQSAIQGVNAVVKELAKSARGSGTSRLLAVEVVHCLVHEETESEAVV